MRAIKFKDMNIVFGENQKEYRPLPGLIFKTKNGEVVTCHKANFWKRVKFLFTGKVWMMQITFNAALQPIKMDVDRRKIYSRPTDNMNWKARRKYKAKLKEAVKAQAEKERKIQEEVDKQKNYAKHLKTDAQAKN